MENLENLQELQYLISEYKDSRNDLSDDLQILLSDLNQRAWLSLAQASDICAKLNYKIDKQNKIKTLFKSCNLGEMPDSIVETGEIVDSAICQEEERLKLGIRYSRNSIWNKGGRDFSEFHSSKALSPYNEIEFENFIRQDLPDIKAICLVYAFIQGRYKPSTLESIYADDIYVAKKIGIATKQLYDAGYIIGIELDNDSLFYILSEKGWNIFYQEESHRKIECYVDYADSALDLDEESIRSILAETRENLAWRLLISNADLARMYRFLEENHILISQEALENVSLSTQTVYRLMNKDALNDEQEEVLTNYLERLIDGIYIGIRTNTDGCPKYVIDFLRLLPEKTSLYVMNRLYDKTEFRGKPLEKALLKLRSDKVFEDYYTRMKQSETVVQKADYIRKLLDYYPMKVSEITDYVKSVDNTDLYYHIPDCLYKLGIPLRLAPTMKNVHREAAVYAKCLEYDISVHELISILHRENGNLIDLSPIEIVECCKYMNISTSNLGQGNEKIAEVILDWILNHRSDKCMIQCNGNSEGFTLKYDFKFKYKENEYIHLCSLERKINQLQQITELWIEVEDGENSIIQSFKFPNNKRLQKQYNTHRMDLNLTYQENRHRVDRLSTVNGLNSIKSYLLNVGRRASWVKDSDGYHVIYNGIKYHYTPTKNDSIAFSFDIGDQFEYRYDDRKFSGQLKGLLEGEGKKKNSVTNAAVKSKVQPKKNIQQGIIGIADFIVRTSGYYCTNRNHQLQRIKAMVNIMSNGSVREVSTDAAYCPDCNKYYILESDYYLLKRQGHICCKVVELEELVQNSRNSSAFANWQSKSLLRMYGYNVNQNEMLTSKDRHRILSFVMENKIMSSDEIVNHLQLQIKMRKGRNNMQTAINKWQECFLQPFFGESCKTFLENCASPFWQKLQRPSGCACSRLSPLLSYSDC